MFVYSMTASHDLASGRGRPVTWSSTRATKTDLVGHTRKTAGHQCVVRSTARGAPEPRGASAAWTEC